LSAAIVLIVGNIIGAVAEAGSALLRTDCGGTSTSR